MNTQVQDLIASIMKDLWQLQDLDVSLFDQEHIVMLAKVDGLLSVVVNEVVPQS